MEYSTKLLKCNLLNLQFFLLATVKRFSLIETLVRDFPYSQTQSTRGEHSIVVLCLNRHQWPVFFELKLETSFNLLQFSFKKKLYTLHLNADTIGVYAGIAQLVEQRIRNAWVVGSNPILGSLYPP